MYGIKDTLRVNLKSAGISKLYKLNFEGVINFIKDQQINSQAKSIQRWAAKYMSELDCKSCGGSRLNIESSNFKVADKSISEVSNVDMLKFSMA